MKLKRIIDLSLKNGEKIVIPKDEQWLVSLFSIYTGFNEVQKPLTDYEPRLYVGDLPLTASGTGKIIGFCFSKNNYAEKIRLKKYGDIAIMLKENESWIVPDGKILVATTKGLGFIPDALGKYYVNGGTKLNAEKSAFLTGVLFNPIKE